MKKRDSRKGFKDREEIQMKTEERTRRRKRFVFCVTVGKIVRMIVWLRCAATLFGIVLLTAAGINVDSFEKVFDALLVAVSFLCFTIPLLCVMGIWKINILPDFLWLFFAVAIVGLVFMFLKISKRTILGNVLLLAFAILDLSIFWIFERYMDTGTIILSFVFASHGWPIGFATVFMVGISLIVGIALKRSLHGKISVAIEEFDRTYGMEDDKKITRSNEMENCIFCKIIRGEIPSAKVYEDEELIVIKDIEPKAKLHYLCIPKEHFAYLSQLDENRADLLKRCFLKIAELRDTLGLQDGYRIIINQGENGGQTVRHLHIHLLGGEPLTGF